MEAALLTFLYYVFLGWYTVYRSMKIAKKTLKIMPWNMKIMVHTSTLQVPCWCSGICMSLYVQERKNLVGWQGTRDKLKDKRPAD